MTRLLTSALMVVCIVSTTYAQTRNWIYQWNPVYNVGGDPSIPDPNYLTVLQGAREVTIFEGIPGETFEFEARTEELQGEEWVDIGPGDINLIEAEVNAGPVTLTIVGHNGHTHGAKDVREINLGAGGVDGIIGQVNISEDFGEWGDTYADAISGAVTIGGDARRYIVIAGPISAPMTIGGLQRAHINCASLADLTAMGTGTHTGSITVQGSYGHTIFLNGSTTDFIETGGPLSGVVEVAGDCDEVWIHSDVLPGGRIIVGNDADDVVVAGDMSGEITVGNDVTDLIWVEDLYGDITVGNDVADYAGNIWVTANLRSTGRILIGGHIAGQVMIGNEQGVGGTVTAQGDLTGRFDTTLGRVAHPSRSEGWGRDSVRPNALTSFTGAGLPCCARNRGILGRKTGVYLSRRRAAGPIIG